MTQRSRAFDDLANLVANATGAVKGVADEARAVGRARAEKIVADLDLVTRDEFEVIKARLDAQAAEIAELKAALRQRPPAKTAPAKTASAKTTKAKTTSTRKTAKKD